MVYGKLFSIGFEGLIASSALRLIDFGQEAEEDPEQLLRRRYGNSVGSLISIDVVKHEGLRTLCGSKWAVSCSVNIKSNTVVESTARSFCPTSIRSGSHTDIGPRRSNEDQHITIDDDLSKHLGDAYKWGLSSSFYALFDGHNGSEAASYVKEHAMRLFFEDSDLPQVAPTGALDADDLFLKQVEESHNKAFSQADLALADECSVSDYCGTTALTVLIVGRHIIIANAGYSRAVLCKNGSATQMTQDHKGSTCLQ
ncbi:putative protein-serine/threonine phosphatase [Helianthus annuus]|nr:putative protein-serine/threonine phosphatase [Helianthus annuus]